MNDTVFIHCIEFVIPDLYNVGKRHKILLIEEFNKVQDAFYFLYHKKVGEGKKVLSDS